MTNKWYIILFSVVSLICVFAWLVLDIDQNVAGAATWILLPGFIVSILFMPVFEAFGLTGESRPAFQFWVEAAWFDALIVVFSVVFWILFLLGLRAFFVRAYEVLK